MRVAIVAESFLPVVNGVVNSVLRVLEHLRDTGHEAMVVAPAARDGAEQVDEYAGFPVVRVPAVAVPMINSLPIGVPVPAVTRSIRDFAPDVVHLASPFVLGGAGAVSARMLGIPCVAVYQTDVPGFAGSYHLRALTTAAWQWVRTMHNSCTLTLAPSSVTIADLEAHGVENVHHWGRGVDTVRFDPAKRDDALRAAWIREGARRRGEAVEGERHVVGYVGRLASEKSVDRLAALMSRRDIQVVVVGDGPERARLERLLPYAVFTGGLYGEDLPRAMASLDVFVHTGDVETFCQTIQEAQASGVPTVAPAAGGPVDLVVDGVNGRLLPPARFARELPAAVDTVLAEGAGARAQARESVLPRTWTGLCTQLVEYYEQALAMEDFAAGARWGAWGARGTSWSRTPAA
ncbi:glycosyltransferase family 4 protein [Corynebacterium bovis]|uniref:Alpha-mannosyltransferase n=1 Tax=Corynebacterium bovis TaxID=36808 RepID=A0A426PWS7_9CORY|nr:glycosyltransferase family 1 protein [Corynebacterium bovis]MDN8579383.1 glycosyltransferase family 1 protein [Corynebacterium bovis]RRO85883.1 alpha-mannosyltransferase [Corynebacterium bovis]RRO88056.1 alpha-mannosyltransferase [Corynebacterium bovis]